MSVLPNSIYRFTAIPVRITGGYFVDISKLIIWSLCGEIKTRNSQQDIEGEQSWKTDFKTHCKTTLIKTARCCQKNRQIDPWNRTEPRNRPRQHGRWPLRGAKSLSTNGAGPVGLPLHVSLDTDLTASQTLIRAGQAPTRETQKSWMVTGENPGDLGLGNGFLDQH